MHRKSVLVAYYSQGIRLKKERIYNAMGLGRSFGWVLMQVSWGVLTMVLVMLSMVLVVMVWLKLKTKVSYQKVVSLS